MIAAGLFVFMIGLIGATRHQKPVNVDAIFQQDAFNHLKAHRFVVDESDPGGVCDLRSHDRCHVSVEVAPYTRTVKTFGNWKVVKEH